MICNQCKKEYQEKTKDNARIVNGKPYRMYISQCPYCGKQMTVQEGFYKGKEIRCVF